MNRLSKAILYLPLIAILSVVFSPTQAKAAVIAEQTNISGTQNSDRYIQQLGTGLTGTLGSISFFGSSVSPDGLEPYMYRCPDATYTGCTQVVDGVTFATSTGSTDVLITSDVSSLSLSLDPTKYYYLEAGFRFTQALKLRGATASTSFPDAQCYTTGYVACSTMSTLFFILDSSSTPTIDTRTRIISFTPEEGSTTVSTSVNFTLNGYVNSEDVGLIKRVKFTLHNIDQNVLWGTRFLSPSDIVLYDESLDTAGEFFFSTTTPIGEGNYEIDATLVKSGFAFFNPTTESHAFIVVQPTYIGNITQKMTRDLNAIFASTTATTTAAAANNCNPLGSFDVILCGSFLFVPDAKQIDDLTQEFYQSIFTRVPFGYLTRFIAIVSSNHKEDLPSFSATVMLGKNGTTTFEFDPADMIAGGASLLGEIRDPVNGKTIREITEPLIRLIISFAVVIYIVIDLTHKQHLDMHRKEYN